MHLTSGDGYVTMADGRVVYMFGFADVTGWDPDNVMVDGILAGAYPGPIIALDEDDDVLPQPDQRRHADAARSLRPPHRPLARFPAGLVGLRRSARVRPLHQHGRDPDLLLQRQGSGHLHVPLPRRGHRAHADGHARQPLRATRRRTERRTSTHWARARSTPSSPTTTATARPATTSSSRSR